MEVSSLDQVYKYHKLEIGVGSIISNSFKIGFQNWGRMVLAFLLFACIFWVPYINIGAYVAFSGYVVTMSKSKKITVTDLFNSYYLKKIGDFALLTFLYLGGIIGITLISMAVGSWIALFTVFVPLIVVFYSWSMAGLLILDKDLGALNAIEISNRITYGYKGTMFGAFILMWLIFFGIFLLMFGIFSGLTALMISFNNEVLFTILIILFILLYFAIATLMTSIGMGCAAYIYRILEKRITIASHPTFFNYLSSDKSVIQEL